MASTAPSLRWRVIDIVTAAVLGVACGLIFLSSNQVGGASYEFLKTIGPGVGGLVTGVWLLGGTLGGYVIRARRRVLRRVDTAPSLYGLGLPVGRWHLIYSGSGPGPARRSPAPGRHSRFNATIVALRRRVLRVRVTRVFPLRPHREGPALTTRYLVWHGVGHRPGRPTAWGADERARKDGCPNASPPAAGARELSSIESMDEAHSPPPRPASSPGRARCRYGGARARAAGMASRWAQERRAVGR